MRNPLLTASHCRHRLPAVQCALVGGALRGLGQFHVLSVGHVSPELLEEGLDGERALPLPQHPHLATVNLHEELHPLQTKSANKNFNGATTIVILGIKHNTTLRVCERTGGDNASNKSDKIVACHNNARMKLQKFKILSLVA